MREREREGEREKDYNNYYVITIQNIYLVRIRKVMAE